ncbi:MAG TPA: hypothetical protein VGS57_04125 [Thermoanaerobaculia bacterium]|jgi:hypothetical protein|nr:hypothetical protein [Thermoanaerobaculia bacterium]
MRNKIIFLVLLAVAALASVARAQQAPRGYYDQQGRYHEYTQNDGYYDQYGVWHPNDATRNNGYYDSRGVWHPADTGNGSGYYDRDGVWHPTDARSGNGYYDRDGVWHPTDTRSGNGYYDRNGVWQSYGNDSYRRAVGPDRWTWSDNRGRAESLSTAARNFALTADALAREATRRSNYGDRTALDALRQLDERAQYFSRAVQSNRNLVGQAYVDLVDSYLAVRGRFGVLDPDGRLSNQFHVMSAALGRIDKRFFGSRVFGGQLPDQGGYGYNDNYGYDRYGNPLPGYDRDGRSTRPYPY